MISEGLITQVVIKISYLCTPEIFIEIFDNTSFPQEKRKLFRSGSFATLHSYSPPPTPYLYTPPYENKNKNKNLLISPLIVPKIAHSSPFSYFPTPPHLIFRILFNGYLKEALLLAKLLAASIFFSVTMLDVFHERIN